MHPAGGSAQGYAPDVEIQYKELQRVEDLIHRLLAQHTGQTEDQIAADFDRDRFMSAQEALEYGLVDQIVRPSDGDEKGEAEGEAEQADEG
jgi:ATP-dependent Clp protease protease subunit